MNQLDLFAEPPETPGMVFPDTEAVYTPDYRAWTALQERAFTQVYDAIAAGKKSLVLAAPTGFGKTRLAQMIIERIAQRNGWNWSFATHRRMLMEQTRQSFVDRGIAFGCRASGYEHDENSLPGQMLMIPSEKCAVRDGRRTMHPSQIVLIDEAHANKSGWAEEYVRWHQSNGAIVLGLSATPLGLGHLYQDLEVLCNNSELRAAGGILMADVFCPFEVDVKDVQVLSGGEFNQRQLGERFAVQQVVGGVYDWWKKLNPHSLPALLFAPGVRESMWFVDEFMRRGVRAAHVDGEDVYLGQHDSAGNPIVYRSDKKMRQLVRDLSERGDIKIVCNRFVFREGCDWPHLYHGIFATAFNTEESWVQACGRILRAYPKYDRVLITDHGGNVWRPSLGSPNIDREWSLEETNRSRAKKAKEKLESGEEKPAVNCPGCQRPINWKHWQRNGNKCPWCGKLFKRSIRWVQQTDGELARFTGDTVKVKRRQAEAQKAWDAMYFPSLKSKRPVASTFQQLVNRFHKQNPKFKVVLDRKANQTIVVHRESGERVMLGNAPKPTDPCWNQQVRYANREQLQRKPTHAHEERTDTYRNQEGTGGGGTGEVREHRREGDNDQENRDYLRESLRTEFNARDD